jgi:arylsulfatase
VTQTPIQGISFAYTFDDPKATTRHRTQYFEMFGHRAIDHDGWRAVCPWPGPSFAEAEQPFGAAISAETLTDLDANHWELYNVTDDPTENTNVAAEHRDILIGLIAQWYVEAGKYDVLPIDGTAVSRLMTERPSIAEPRNQYILRPGTQTVPGFAAPRVLNRPHAITADVEIPDGGAEGVLLCQGSGVGGWSLFMKDGKLHYTHNYVRRANYRVSSKDIVPAGRHELRFEFEPTGPMDLAKGAGTPGRAQLYIDKKLVGEADIPVTIPIAISPGGLACGANPGLPVDPEYPTPFRFTGTLHTVTVDLSGDLITDSESEMRVAMSRQ